MRAAVKKTMGNELNGMLVGDYTHNVDAKGRVFVPAKFRLVPGQRFYMCRGVGGCIRAYSEEEFAKVVELLDSATVRDIKAKRRVLASTVDVDMDSQGRVLLPETLRQKVGITDKVRIIGMSTWMEFWQPELYDEVMGDDNADEEEELDFLASRGIG